MAELTSPVTTPVTTRPEPARRPPTVRVARWSATHPWRAVALWLVFVAACVALGSLVSLRSSTALQTSTGQSGRALHLLHQADLVDPATEDVLITARQGSLTWPPPALLRSTSRPGCGPRPAC